MVVCCHSLLLAHDQWRIGSHFLQRSFPIPTIIQRAVRVNVRTNLHIFGNKMAETDTISTKKQNK